MAANQIGKSNAEIIEHFEDTATGVAHKTPEIKRPDGETTEVALSRQQGEIAAVDEKTKDWAATDTGLTYPATRVYNSKIYRVIDGQTSTADNPETATTIWEIIGGEDIGEIENKTQKLDASGNAIAGFTVEEAVNAKEPIQKQTFDNSIDSINSALSETTITNNSTIDEFESISAVDSANQSKKYYNSTYLGKSATSIKFIPSDAMVTSNTIQIGIYNTSTYILTSIKTFAHGDVNIGEVNEFDLTTLTGYEDGVILGVDEVITISGTIAVSTSGTSLIATNGFPPAVGTLELGYEITLTQVTKIDLEAVKADADEALTKSTESLAKSTANELEITDINERLERDNETGLYPDNDLIYAGSSATNYVDSIYRYNTSYLDSNQIVKKVKFIPSDNVDAGWKNVRITLIEFTSETTTTETILTSVSEGDLTLGAVNEFDLTTLVGYESGVDLSGDKVIGLSNCQLLPSGESKFSQAGSISGITFNEVAYELIISEGQINIDFQKLYDDTEKNTEDVSILQESDSANTSFIDNLNLGKNKLSPIRPNKAIVCILYDDGSYDNEKPFYDYLNARGMYATSALPVDNITVETVNKYAELNKLGNGTIVHSLANPTTLSEKDLREVVISDKNVYDNLCELVGWIPGSEGSNDDIENSFKKYFEFLLNIGNPQNTLNTDRWKVGRIKMEDIATDTPQLIYEAIHNTCADYSLLIIYGHAYAYDGVGKWTTAEVEAMYDYIQKRQLQGDLITANVTDAVRLFLNPLSQNINKSGASSGRPSSAYIGFQYYDTTLSKPIWLTSIGNKHKVEFEITSAPTSNGNITITVDDNSKAIPVTTADSASEIVSRIRDYFLFDFSFIDYEDKLLVVSDLRENKTGAFAFTDTGSTGVTATVTVKEVGVSDVWKDIDGVLI